MKKIHQIVRNLKVVKIKKVNENCMLFQEKEEKGYRCPECGTVLIYDNRITPYLGIVWFYECEKCDVKYPELRIKKSDNTEVKEGL
ncbi:hypothetical protein LCGC14_2629110 [marine sediment metagenome]|uniref:Uncharacterized protein n=1 Tax=marine sediment metagenome TaxID=412755 RepID=A0A0F9CBT1_9ZZZZ